jgi:hypothetical protein
MVQLLWVPYAFSAPAHRDSGRVDCRFAGLLINTNSYGIAEVEPGLGCYESLIVSQPACPLGAPA